MATQAKRPLKNHDQITIYPNPTVQKVMIDVDNPIGNSYRISIFYPVGKVIYAQQFSTDKMEVDTHEWENRRCFCIFEYHNKTIASGNIIISK